jgi:predicted enzyme related to lactoylglutathione lyase
MSIEVTLDAVDAEAAASFWREALGYQLLHVREPYFVLGPQDGGSGPRVVIQRVAAVTAGKTTVHLDLRVDDPDAEVARLQDLGATIAWEVDETSHGFIRWTVMIDPHGTHFCVCPARSADGNAT